MTATDASAEGDLRLQAGRNVNLLAALDHAIAASQHDRFFAGISANLSSPLIGAGNSLANAAQGLGGRDGQYSLAPSALAAYRTVQALGKAEDAYNAWQKKGGDLKDMPADLGSVSITAGFQHSSSRMLQDSATPVGTSLRSGGSTTIEAEQGSIHAVGARIAAGIDAQGRPTGEPGNISLTAGQGILLESAQATIDRIFGARSMQAAVGFDPIKGGPAGSAGYASDTGQSHEVRQVDSQVSGTGTVSLTSGGDTSLRGATVTGGQIVASVGGDLTIESRFDTARYRESSIQAQARLGGGSVSGSASRGSVRGDSANVSEQSGLVAGAGGYQLSVGGGVNLIGGVITSTADPSQNRLSADHLTFSDLLGSTRAMSSSMGFSLGAGGLPLPQVGMPVQQSSSGFARATLSPGELDLRNQGQDLSGLNRDASAASRQAQPYDIERLQARQRSAAALSELMNIGVGELSARIGLAEGSAEKTVLHAAVGALTAQLAGGNVASGALAGAASEVANGVLQQVLRANPNLTDEQKAAITQWVGTAVGALAGGQLGAATGLDNVTHNYLTHKQLQDLATDLKACDSAADAASCKSEVSKKYEAIDFNQERILEACRTSECLSNILRDMDLDENKLYLEIMHLQELGLDLGFGQRLLANQVNERPLTGDGMSILSQKVQDVIAGVSYCEASGQSSGCFAIGQTLKYFSSSVNDAIYAALGSKAADLLLSPFSSLKAERSALIAELPPGTKITPDNVVEIRKLSDGTIVWLETGTDTAGLQHIYSRHADDFAAKGIGREEVPGLIMDALEHGQIVGTSGKANVYHIQRGGKDYNIAIGVGSNGFIVRANPVSEWKKTP